MNGMESCEINGLREAIAKLSQYSKLGTPEEIRVQRQQLMELTAERDRLQADCDQMSQQVERQKRILWDLNLKLDKLEGRYGSK